MTLTKYKILGMPGAGSLIAEFLFCEIGVDYDISFVNLNDLERDKLNSVHPLGKIPVLQCIYSLGILRDPSE